MRFLEEGLIAWVKLSTVVDISQALGRQKAVSLTA